MLTAVVPGSSVTYDKNPDYWGYDEKYLENHLPYVDQLRALIIAEVATRLAAIRAGKIDMLGAPGTSALRSIDVVESLQRTNPELLIWPAYGRSNNGYGLNTLQPPFNDIRVRKAMQMALDLETINPVFYNGLADTIPQGRANRFLTEMVTQFEDWPEEVKKGYMYDPGGAEKLLDEAGYPRGADGVRFKTVLNHFERYDANYSEIAAAYWRQIGVDIEIQIVVESELSALRRSFDYEMQSAELANTYWPTQFMQQQLSDSPYKPSVVSDPAFDALFEASSSAKTIEERNRLFRELDMYGIERWWFIWGPIVPSFSVSQPWLAGYNGEPRLGSGGHIWARLWIDQALKTAMGR